MTVEKKSVLQSGVPGLMILLAGWVFAGFTYIYALPKAHLAGPGPGIRVALMNQRAETAISMFHFITVNWWIAAIYYVISMAIVVFLVAKRVPELWRVLVAGVLLVPVGWYSSHMVYLGGKLLTCVWINYRPYL